MMKNFKRALALFGMAAVLYWMVSGRFIADTSIEPKPAAEFSLEDLSGKTVSLSDFKGQVVLIDFWATWCDPCIDELPDLIRLYKKFKDRGFSIVGIAVGDEKGSVVEFAKDNRIPYPLLLEGDDPVEGYPVPGVPAAYLIDRTGLIVGQYFGPKSFAVLVADVQKLL